MAGSSTLLHLPCPLSCTIRVHCLISVLDTASAPIGTGFGFFFLFTFAVKTKEDTFVCQNSVFFSDVRINIGLILIRSGNLYKK